MCVFLFSSYFIRSVNLKGEKEQNTNHLKIVGTKDGFKWVYANCMCCMCLFEIFFALDVRFVDLKPNTDRLRTQTIRVEYFIVRPNRKRQWIAFKNWQTDIDCNLKTKNLRDGNENKENFKEKTASRMNIARKSERDGATEAYRASYKTEENSKIAVLCVLV